MFPLSPEQLERVNAASLHILEQTGVRIEHPSIQQMLLEAGAAPGEKADMLRLPRGMVREALERAPGHVKLASLDGSEVLLTPCGPTLFWTGNALYLTEGKQAQPITTESFARLVRVVERLEQVHGMVGTSLEDVPAPARDFVGLRIMAQHCRKHLRPCLYTPDGALACIEMAQALVGGTPLRERPVLSLGYTCLSPLHWAPEALEVFIRSSGFGVPLMINSEPIAGATAPVTLAGALALANAEALAGLVIVQMLEPGRPVIFNLGFAHTMDMRTTVTRTGSAETGLLAAAGAQLARCHGLPSASWMSTEAMLPDAQAAYEEMLTGLLHVMGGVNVVWGVGQLESQRTMSMTQAVIGNEMIASLRRVQQGIVVNEETLAVELIGELGAQADYLSQEHTRAHFREELTETRLGCNVRRGEWERTGAPTLRQAAQQQVEAILAEPPQQYLTGEQSKELERIEGLWRRRLTA